MSKLSRPFLPGILMLVVILAIPGLAEPDKTGKRALTHDDYDSWKSIKESAISPAGDWILYLETPQDGDADLVVKSLQDDRVFRHTIGYSGEGIEAHQGAKAQFSYAATHVIFMVSPSKKEFKKSEREKKEKLKGADKADDKDKAKKKLGIMDLAGGKVILIDQVKSFKLPKEAGGWLAYLKEAAPKPEEKKEDKDKEGEEVKEEEGKDKKGKKKEKKYGTPLVLRSLKYDKEIFFEEVLEYYFTKDGKYIFFVVASKEKPATDGVYKHILESGATVPLLTGKGDYKKWAMNKQETHLAFLTNRDDQGADEREATFNLYGCRLGDSKAALWVSHTAMSNFPKGMAVSDRSGLTFDEHGRVVMFGIKEIPAQEKDEEAETGEVKEEPEFDLWHWNDPYPQPQQQKMAKKVRDNTWESVYHINKKRFVKLADKDLPDVELQRKGKIAFAQTGWPYTKLVSYYGSFYDVYVIDIGTGKKTLVKKRIYNKANLSPNGKYVYWFEDKNWFVYDIGAKTTRNITAGLGVRFDREDWDTPNPPLDYGVAGWTDNDESILVNDRYDIWEILPDGSKARCITEGYGRTQQVQFRYVALDPEAYTINPKGPLLLRAVNLETRASGFYHDQVRGNDPPRQLIWADRHFDFDKKAKREDRLLFTRETFDEYPDLWVSGLEFKDARQATDLGRQMAPFLWGKTELRSFYSADGKPLRGVLIKPENFDPRQKYPLMVYIYETLHTYMTHRFRHPAPGTSVNPSYYVSSGYVMWLPDIEYDTGYPGRDALKCVLPGIQMLVREGFIDPKAIGIQGHSWGGYQVAYMVTQTNIFTAAVAGAPVSNMISAYNGIRWGSGMVRQFQYERSQSRLGETLWNVPLRYIENSPIFWADKIQTPLLMLHNDRDGAVPWYQGIELIMALRRLGKEAYMFNYKGEEHVLKKRLNLEHWTRCLAEFFDHHLKGAPAPGWMTDGIKAWEKKDKE